MLLRTLRVPYLGPHVHCLPSLGRRYLFAVPFFLLCYNGLSYAANLLWTFLHRLIILLRTVLAQLKILGGVVAVFVRTTSLHLHQSHLHMVRATLSINVPTFSTVAQNHQVRRADSVTREFSS
jgi:hypothetical protein